MQRAIPNYEGCRRYKDVSVPWAEYDKSRSNEIKRILDLSELFEELDKTGSKKRIQVIETRDSFILQDILWSVLSKHNQCGQGFRDIQDAWNEKSTLL